MSPPGRGVTKRPERRDAVSPFTFYVEGPSDRELLRIWARRISPGLARALEPCGVILGGRQPARAVQHFRGERQRGRALRAVCILDRDERHADLSCFSEEAGLEFYTWPRRHIESYLLVPRAIGHCAGLSADDSRWGRVLREHLGEDWEDEDALGRLDAKRLLSPTGTLSKALGRRLSIGSVARAIRQEELHRDVVALFDRLREGLGLSPPRPRDVRRPG